MASPILKYNADTGSDTLASGAGPARAVTGASATNGAGKVVNLDGNPDLSGVLADGSHVFWAETALGLVHMDVISAVDDSAKTITTTNSTYVLGGGVNWAIGGVRQTLTWDTASARTDLGAARDGWTYELQDCVADYVVDAELDISKGSLADGPITVRAAAGASPTIRWTFPSILFDVNNEDFLALEGLTVVNEIDTSSNVQCVNIGISGQLTATDCTFVGRRAIYVAGGRAVLTRCDIVGLGFEGTLVHSGGHVILTDCVLHDCGGDGLRNLDGGSLNISGCTFYGNAQSGIEIVSHPASHMVDVSNCTFYNNTGGDILLSDTPQAADGPFTFYNNIYGDGGGYAFSSAATNHLTIWSDFNAYGTHTSGEVLNVLKGEHSITLSADPFVDAAGGDFTLNNVSGGGLACKNAAFSYGDAITWGPTLRPGKPVIEYNADSGSDTLASGAGPAVAVTGTNGDFTPNTLTLNETADFTGAADDGSDVLWYESASAVRRMFAISSFNPSVAACTSLTLVQTAINQTGLNWAVGGVRKSLDSASSRTDVLDGIAGWTYELQESTAEYVAAGQMTAFGLSLTSGPVTVRAAAGATPVISWTPGSLLFSAAGGLVLENLTLSNTTSTSTNANCLNVTSGKFARLLGCTMDSYRTVLNNNGRIQVVDCSISSPSSIGVFTQNTNNATSIIGCRLEVGAGGLAGLYVENGLTSVSSCVFADCTSAGIHMFTSRTNPTPLTVRSSIFRNSSQIGIYFFATPNIASGPYTIVNNVFISNGTYGMDGQISNIDLLAYNNNNAFFNNTSGEVSSDITRGVDSVTLAGDPFVDATGGDYRLNDTAGVALVGTGIPTGWDIGVLQTSGNIGGDQSPAIKTPSLTIVTPTIEQITFKTKVRMGQLTGWAVMDATGEYEGAGNTATGEDVWKAASLSPAGPITLPIPADAGEAMTLVSTSDSDNRVGIGAQAVVIDYLDAAGTEQRETISLQGTTPVNTLALDMRFIQKIQVDSAGSAETAIGDIRIYKTGGSSTTDLYSFILAGDNVSLLATRMVPAGKTLLLQGWRAEEAQGKSVAFRVRSTDSSGIVTPRVFLLKGTSYLNNGPSGVVAMSDKIPALSVVKVSIWPDAVASDGSAHWWGYLVDNA